MASNQVGRVHRVMRVLMRHRLACVAVLLAITAISALGALRLQVDDRVRNLVKSDSPEFQVFQDFLESFGSDDNDCLVVLQGSDMLAPGRLRAVHRLVTELGSTEGIESVYSLFNIRGRRQVGEYVLPLFPSPDLPPDRLAQARVEAMQHPLVVGQLLSADARTMLVVVRLEGQALPLTELKSRLDRMRTVLDRSLAGSAIDARLTGIPALRVDIVGHIQRSQVVFAFITVILASAVALVLFRRVAALVIVGVGPVMGVIWTLGIVGLLGQKLTPITTVLPSLVLAIGFTDALHLLFHIRHARKSAGRREAALSASVLWLPSWLTALTTMIGFGSLVVTRLEGIRDFGLSCALGALVNCAVVFVVTLLLASTRLGDHLLPRNDVFRRITVHLMVQRLLPLLTRYSRRIYVAALIVTLAGIPAFFLLQPDSRVGEFLPHGSESYRALRHCEEVFGGALFVQAVVQWPEGQQVVSPNVLRCLKCVHEAFENEPTMSGPVSVLTLLESLPAKAGPAERLRQLKCVPAESLGRMVRLDQRRALVAARVPDLGGRALEKHFLAVERRFAQIEDDFPGFSVQLTGSTVVSYRNVNSIIGDLMGSPAIAAALIFGSVAVILGSWRLGLLSLLPNLFPLTATALLLVLVGDSLRYVTVMAFTISLGIVVDDTIHFLARLRSELAAGDGEQMAVQRCLRDVGPPMIAATLVMLAGFGALLVSDMPPLRQFGALACVLLVLALLGDAVILPAQILAHSEGRRRRPGDPPRLRQKREGEMQRSH